MFTYDGLAYIDPTSGTVLLQALAAAALGLAWRVSMLFKRGRRNASNSTTAEEQRSSAAATQDGSESTE